MRRQLKTRSLRSGHNFPASTSAVVFARTSGKRDNLCLATLPLRSFGVLKG
jgi:hypothetical protein